MLEQQRQKASFDKKELSYAIYGGKQGLQRFLKLQNIVSNDQILKFDPQNIQNSRQQCMLDNSKKIVRYNQLFRDQPYQRSHISLFFDNAMPLSQHFYMFLHTLQNLCDQKQKIEFYEPAKKGKLIGCYAQTQLAHGSDIKSLQTTATFDEQKDEFIIHTPSVGAAKWWIGDLGVNANHAIIFAQLIIKDQNFGLHPFLVPIRDENHKPFPQIQVGDIGPKLGYSSRDNGYIIFHHYRIPRRNMLMKYTQVSRNGIYKRVGNQKISYATMLMIRSIIPSATFQYLSKGAVIATRYSLIRKQFKNQNDEQIPILDYQIQQEKVICRTAQVYSMFFSSCVLKQLGKQVYMRARDFGDFSRLNQAHTLSSGLKAISTNQCINGLQILRRSAGGHGFSKYSGLPTLINEGVPAITYQGQNTILFLQVTRFLIKSLQKIQKGMQNIGPSVQYLREAFNNQSYKPKINSQMDFFQIQNIRKIYLHASCQQVKKASNRLLEKISQQIDMKQIWDSHLGIELADAAVLHIYYWIIENFILSIYSRTQNEKVRSVLFKLFCLYATDKILQRSQMFFQTKVMTPSDMKYCFKAKEELLKQLRPEALALVQAFEYDDNTLCSAIGRSDGKAYETLLDWAKNKNVVNKPQIKKQILEILLNAKNQIRPKI